MAGWQSYINSLMKDGLCCDAAVVSIPHQQLMAAHHGGVLVNLTQAEIQTLLGRNRAPLLTQGLTLGGLQCLVIRDNLYEETHSYTMDLRTKHLEDDMDNYTHAVTVTLVSSVCLILIGHKGIQGGMLNLKAFEIARYIKDTVRQ
ncbi:profilin-1-like [Alligator mississippiensis]|uniref:profilin-1-like n=1 Tax=Alligator mississippiensis TaxID=8496 RepID=UPI0028779581|nr:profilin-1-like [Alligator mississippiensis]